MRNSFAASTKSAGHNFEAKLFCLSGVYSSQALFTWGKEVKADVTLGPTVCCSMSINEFCEHQTLLAKAGLTVDCRQDM